MPAFKYPTPETQPTGNCHWERGGNGIARLIDEAGIVWQEIDHTAPSDTWAGSIQRHETMSDNF